MLVGGGVVGGASLSLKEISYFLLREIRYKVNNFEIEVGETKRTKSCFRV